MYMVQCRDGTFYCGITTDLERRIIEHNEGEKGAKYTRPRRPVKLVYNKACTDRSEATKEEWRLKQLSRKEKLLLAGQK